MMKSKKNYALVILSFLIVFIATNAKAQDFFNPKDLLNVGVYYYPEHWSPDQWDRDLKNIADLGFEFIHMSEFAWAQLEPEEGKYDFDWLDKVIDIAHKNGLKVILGTPTPCPPVWLGIKYPEIYLKDGNYQSKEHGTRANMSLSDAIVKEYTKKIVTAMATHYATNKSVMGWQIDNEPEAKEDYSDASQKAFQHWLQNKYQSIEKLNNAWGTAFWSQLYASFDQIRIHNKQNVGWWGANPIALLDFKRFCADNQASFLDMQANILREYIPKNQFVTTNYVAMGSQTDPKRCKMLDFASFTAYPNYGSNNLGDLGFRLGDYHVLMYANDYFKSVNGLTGVMELQPGQVNWANYNSLLQPGTVRMWLWNCFAGGCSFACTYRYRQILYGAEQYHNAIITTDGTSLSEGGKEYVQFIKEIQKLRQEKNKNTDLPEKLKDKRTAILWSYDNVWNLDRQKQTLQWNTWGNMQRYQQILHSLGVPVSFVSEDDDWSDYDYLVVPAFEMVDQTLVDKWINYAKKGGNLILTARTGAKDKNAHLWESNLSGILNNLIGGKVTEFDMLPPGKTGEIKMGEKNYAWSTWADLIQPDKNSEVLASLNDQFYKGTATCLKNKTGKGMVWYIGAVSKDGDLEKDILKEMYKENHIACSDYPEGVFVEYRQGYMVAFNYSSKEYKLDYNGGFLIGNQILEPAGVAVWKYSEK